MTIEAPPSPARQDQPAAVAAPAGQPPALPSRVAGWSVRPVSAGLWLSAAGREAPAEVRALEAEPDRLSLIIEAAGPDQRTDKLLAELLPALSSSAPRLRLVLPAAAARYASAARSYGVDLIVAEAQVAITPWGCAVVRPAGPEAGGGLPQWRRFLPSGDQQAAGWTAPAAAWERGLDDAAAAAAAQGMTVRRVPAGLALGRAEVAAGSAPPEAVWPDADRVTIVVSDEGPAADVLSTLGRLLPLLPLGSTDGVRLYWPRAASGQAAAGLSELAAEVGADLIAPAGDLAVTGCGAVTYSQSGAAPWLRYRRGEVEVLGSLYPEPAWERGLATADLDSLPDGVVVEHTASGLCVSGPGQPGPGLAQTARSILPDPSSVTIVAAGDAHDPEPRQAVESVLDRLPPDVTRAIRLLLSGAAAGGPESFAQLVANAAGATVTAPAGRWTATPDGRVRLLPSAEAPGAGGRPWPKFRPCPAGSAGPAEPAPAPPSAEPDKPPPPPSPASADGTSRPEQPSVPEQPSLPDPDPDPAPAPQPTAGVIVPVPRGHRSSPEERQQYRESSARYQSRVVSVRRVLTQRPGLRAAAVLEGEEVVVTDFAAVLDLLSDDQREVAAALRSGRPPGPRVACVVSGLRRLPSFTGAVFASAASPAGGAAAYAAGAALLEPAFVYSTSARQAALDGTISYVIWSETGKRVSALAANLGPAEIVFAAGSVFKVLRADLSGSGSGRATIFLRESSRPGTESAGAELDVADQRILDRLAEAAALRDGVASGDTHPGGVAGQVLQPIGLDDRGIPFAAAS
jgi:hypothetical protein